MCNYKDEKPMPKSSKKQMEDDEKKIIVQLQIDPKRSINEIAKSCGFSRQKVWRIIKQLEGDNTIWGYNVVIDDEKINVNQYVFLIKSSPKPIKKIVEDISDLSLDDSAKDMGIDIQSGGMVNGKYDWILVFTAKDVKHAKKFKDVFLSKYSSIVSEVDLLEYIFPIKKCCIANPEVKKLNELF
jgi:DNA-binding Lrp family transcriptional regulator